MRPRAFLLCPDEKALEAITHVLADLHVSFERIQETGQAIRMLATQAFDAVLIDCDNEKAAGPLFQGIRQSAQNQSCMVIAICDGKTGVPKAFRLGAALVLTKPVALEQVRNTVRTALAMKRKEEVKATAAAASSTGTGVAAAKPAPLVPVAPEPKTRAASAPPSEVPSVFATPLAPRKPARNEELDEFAAAEFQERTQTKRRSAPLPPAKRKSSPYGTVAVLLALVLLAAGGYFAWMTVPAFHQFVQQQYEKAYLLIKGKPAPSAAKPPVVQAVQPVPAPAPAPVTPPPQPLEGFVSAADIAAKASAPASPVSSGTVSLSSDSSPKNDATPITLPDDVADQHVISRVSPALPARAKAKGIKGDVVLQIEVSKEGAVDSVEVVSGDATLAKAAVEAVQQWRYEVYYHNDQPAPFRTQATVHFPPVPAK
jgi:TonB family protein